MVYIYNICVYVYINLVNIFWELFVLRIGLGFGDRKMDNMVFVIKEVSRGVSK